MAAPAPAPAPRWLTVIRSVACRLLCHSFLRKVGTSTSPLVLLNLMMFHLLASSSFIATHCKLFSVFFDSIGRGYRNFDMARCDLFFRLPADMHLQAASGFLFHDSCLALLTSCYSQTSRNMQRNKTNSDQPEGMAVVRREVITSIVPDTGMCRRCSGISFDLTVLYNMERNFYKKNEVQLCKLEGPLLETCHLCRFFMAV
jgi:hypothetical protein